MRSLRTFFLALFFVIAVRSAAQQIPSPDEKIPFACTFSKDADPSWGDDDFIQIVFFVIPESWKKPVFIRIFDPEVGGKNDENHGAFNSRTRFSVYGGSRAHSEPAARSPDHAGNYKSGILLSARIFGNDNKYDDQWVSMGPFNPAEGELQPDIGGRVLKIVIEGMEGDDGNLYRLFISSDPNSNKTVEGANGFAYEYTFRLADEKGAVAHLYPFVPEGVTAVKIKVFDYDDEGMIRVVSVAKKGDVCHLSQEQSLWMESRHRVMKAEINTSLDVQFIKQKDIRNNNIVVFISNQYGESMPFYTTPIGGIPKYNAKINVVELDE